MARLSSKATLWGAALGFAATLGQITLIRESLLLSGGNEIILVTALFFWVLFVGLGAAIANGLAAGRSLAVAGALLLGPANLLGITVLQSYREILTLEPGAQPDFADAAGILALAIAPFCGLVGFLFTASSRAFRNDTVRAPSTIYCAEAGGAVIAGLLFAWVSRWGIDHVSTALLAGATMAAAPLTMTQSRVGACVCISIATTHLIIALSGGGTAIDNYLTLRSFKAGLAGELIARADSPYGRLEIGKIGSEFQLYVDRQLEYSFPDPWERPVGVHLALTQHPSPRTALFIGGGVPDRVEATLEHNLTRAVFTYTDLEEHRITRKYWGADTKKAVSDDRIELLLEDGRRFVATTDQRFDVVLVDTPPPLSARANRYHTVEFYKQIVRILEPGGSITVRIPGTANVLSQKGRDAAGTGMATFRSVFDYSALSPGTTTYLHGSTRPGVVTGDSQTLTKRFDARVQTANGFSSARFSWLYDQIRARDYENQAAVDKAPVNTDARPLAYLSNLRNREQQVSDSPQGLKFSDITAPLSWGAIGLGIAIWLCFSIRARARARVSISNHLFSIATTGAAGMAIEICVLYAYQVAAGTLYVGLALIVAVFMGGIALGAAASQRYSIPGPVPPPLAADILMGLTAAATWPIIHLWGDSPSVIVLWSAIAGAATGAAFPVFLAQIGRIRKGEHLSAGPVEAADHLGAAVGAMATGLVWLPQLGIGGTCLTLMGLKIISSGGHLFISPRDTK